MTNLMLFRHVLPLLLLLGGNRIVAQTIGPEGVTPSGSARGVVLDNEGKPVAGATVFLEGAVRSPFGRCDAEGKFLITGFSGRWVLRAFKKEDGYPYNFFAFFASSGEQFPWVDVLPGKVTENVIIRLGAKAATIKFDIVNDSGAPVGAVASFSRPDMPEIGTFGPKVSSADSMLVPATALRIAVEADGYKTWHYGDADWQTDKGLIHPRSGETLKLSIQLQRDTSQPRAGQP